MTALERLRRDARRCHAAALAAVEPGRLTAAALRCDRAGIRLVRPGGRLVARHAGPVNVLAVGKAAAAMMAAAVTRLGPAVGRALAVVPPDGPRTIRAGVRVVRGAHPVPSAASVHAGLAALDLAAGTEPDAVLLVLVSGGTSSLLAAPADGVTLADKQAVTRRLLRAGADIAALNAVRKHCSRVKGGGLLRAARRAAGVWTLVLSDVLGDDLATIGSGPTTADPTSFADALDVLERFAAVDASPAVRRRLEAGVRGTIEETLDPADPIVRRGRSVVIGNNATAVEAARRAAVALGYATARLPVIRGDAARAGRALAARVGAMGRGGPRALVAGGEAIVRVVGTGRGGRAQHLALAAALGLDGMPAVVLAVGTDGIDGPTDAAGALVDGTLVCRARRCGIDLVRALAATDSHPALDALGALVRSGPTGTNVADLVVALRGAC